MAPPKRSRVSEGSSSHPVSPPISGSEYATSDEEMGYDEEKFISQEAFAEYKRLMAKTIIKERGFIPVSTDGALVEMIEAMDWVAVCESPSAVPIGIVREFYANAKIERNGSVMVRGQLVDYSPEAIGRLLELPAKPAGAVDWAQQTRAQVDLDLLLAEISVPGTVWTFKKGTTEHVSFPTKALNRYARAWFYFICANISPTQHTSVVTVERAILLYGILNQQYLDLGWLMYQNMRRFMRAVTSGAIPHASVVVRLCSEAGVKWGADEPKQQPMADIDSAYISRLTEWDGGFPDPRGLGYDRQEEAQQERRARGPRARVPRAPRALMVAGASSSQARSGSVPVMTAAQFQQFQRRADRRVDASVEMTRRMFADMTAVLDDIYQQQGIQPQWPVYGAHTVYPPPDSPPQADDHSDDE